MVQGKSLKILNLNVLDFSSMSILIQPSYMPQFNWLMFSLPCP